MKADLHLHSEYSWDSKVPIEKYIQKAEIQKFDAISITDHNNTESHQIIKKLQSTTKLLLIPGQEITTLDGHLLIYGWITNIEPKLTMSETIEIARQKAEKENVHIKCIAAHPFDKFRSGKGRLIFNTGIDGIEILNASCLINYFNSKAKKECPPNFIKLGNSDSHRLSEFGSAFSSFPNIKKIEELFASMNSAEPKGSIIGLQRKMNRFIRRKLGLMSEI